MELESQKKDNVVIIAISGNIVLEDTAKLKEKIEIYIEEKSIEAIVLDCENVKFIDSSGLGLIVSIYKTLKKMNKNFALSSLSEGAMEIFILTKLNKILTITESTEAAIELFQ